MFTKLFDMIAEKPEVTAPRDEYKEVFEDLRAQVLTAPEEGMPEEQEMWAEEWHKRLVRVSDTLKGTGLGVPSEDKLVFVQMHDTCMRWRTEAAQRAEDEKQQVAREREAAEVEAHVRETACACQEEMAREKERAVKEVTMGEPASDEVVVPPHKFTEAFPKGGKDFEPEDDFEGEEVMEATIREDLKGKPQRVVDDLVRRGDEQCTACVEKECKVCWGEDRQVCRRCQSKQVGCSKSTKALREREMSEHSASKGKGKGKGKGKVSTRPSKLEQGALGPSRTSTSTRPWPYLVPMASVSRDMVEADLLQEGDRSMVSNQMLNALVHNLGCLTTQGSFIEAQVQNLKARAMDLNVKVHDVQETHGKYFNQLEYIAAQLGTLMCKAQEFPVEDEDESAQEDSE
ncbi:hypothetical protein PAXINDRAFT_7791 [Paxillus involutus ATCC 200175]|nr:hypothetical protein PAXINDRAFT_7791 [Paxillus involutus ATCC 200175]